MAHPINHSFGLLADPNYRRMWAIGGLTGAARWLEFVAIAIFAYELTHSPAMVALLAVIRMTPYVALGMVVGAIADVYDRRRLLIFSLATMSVVAVVMAVLTWLGLAGYGTVAITTLFAGAFWTVDMPARRGLLVEATGRERMASGLGLDNATNHAMRAVGPLCGGLVYELIGIYGIYVLIAVCYAACAVFASRYRTPPVIPTAGGEDAKPFGRSWLSAILPPRELVLNRRFQILMGVTLVYNLWCFPFVTMVPVIGQKDFAFSPFWVGALSACDGVGGTLGALLVGTAMSDRGLFRFHYLGTTSFLLLVGMMSLMLQPAAAVPILFAIGINAAFFSATQFALIYVTAPPAMRGRATGVLSLFIGSSLIGHYHTGWLFERLGSAPAMRLMAAEGLVAIILLGLAWLHANRTEAHAAK